MYTIGEKVTCIYVKTKLGEKVTCKQHYFLCVFINWNSSGAILWCVFINWNSSGALLCCFFINGNSRGAILVCFLLMGIQVVHFFSLRTNKKP